VENAPPAATNVFLPVLPLSEVCLFPEASLTLVLSTTAAQKAVEIAARTGGQLVALAQRDGTSPRELQTVGTFATVAEQVQLDDGTLRVELDGHRRGRSVTLLGIDTMVAEVEPLDEGDPGDEWGSAVEALARYLHAHPDLRSFLDQQRRSAEPMAWVNLACQHLPITVTARQRLLECGAAERCLKISRGLDALLRKQQGA
jgi:ATP-dependent Lon protease